MIINGIEFELTGKRFGFKDRGVVHQAILACDSSYTWDFINEKLKSQTFKGEAILGVEMFCINNQSGQPIGILIEEQENLKKACT